VPSAAAGAMFRLDLISRLLDDLERTRITYCHWKSNHHLARALTGESDLDLLVAAGDRAAFEELVARSGFVRLLSTASKRLPEVEDHLGLDTATGELVHLHVHYQLVLGEQYVKNHRLPIEEWMLRDTRDLNGVRVPAPEKELLVLYLRSLMKTEATTCLRAWRRGAPHPFPAAIVAEFEWLRGQVTFDALHHAARGSGLESVARSLEAFLAEWRAGALSPGYVFRQKRILLKKLRPFLRQSRLSAGIRKAWYRVRRSGIGRRVRPVTRKVLPCRGLCIALAGADGCGKSSLSRDLPLWLGWKLESTSLYFGQPKDSIVLPVLRKVRRTLLRRASQRPLGGSDRAGNSLRFAAALVESILWLHLARHRVTIAREIERRIAAGHVVFAERFPLRELWTMDAPMDGPRLGRSKSSALLDRIAGAERARYEQIVAPDHVIVLHGSLATLQGRKPDTPLDEHRSKVDAVTAMVEAGTHDVIDVEKPYGQVLLEAKALVWGQLQRSARAEATKAFPKVGGTVAARVNR
jgi:hypothetical protein